METITINISQQEVYGEVAKSTDYTGSKLIDGDEKARDRILASDADFVELWRFWDETIAAAEEWLKDVLVSGQFSNEGEYEATIEVSKNWDKALELSVENTLKSYFIASITGMWFKYTNKKEAADTLASAADMLQNVERLLYTRRRPAKPGTK